jgi:hypothetical protein
MCQLADVSHCSHFDTGMLLQRASMHRRRVQHRVICVAWGALLMYPCHCSTRHADLTCALCSRERDSLRQLDSAGPRSRPIVPDSGDDMHVEFDLSPDFPKLPMGVSPEYAGMMHAALSETPSERPSFGQVHTTLISLHAAAVAAESAAVGVSPAAQVRRPAWMCAHGASGSRLSHGQGRPPGLWCLQTRYRANRFTAVRTPLPSGSEQTHAL